MEDKHLDQSRLTTKLTGMRSGLSAIHPWALLLALFLWGGFTAAWAEEEDQAFPVLDCAPLLQASDIRSACRNNVEGSLYNEDQMIDPDITRKCTLTFRKPGKLTLHIIAARRELIARHFKHEMKKHGERGSSKTSNKAKMSGEVYLENYDTYADMAEGAYQFDSVIQDKYEVKHNFFFLKGNYVAAFRSEQMFDYDSPCSLRQLKKLAEVVADRLPDAPPLESDDEEEKAPASTDISDDTNKTTTTDS